MIIPVARLLLINLPFTWSFTQHHQLGWRVLSPSNPINFTMFHSFFYLWLPGDNEASPKSIRHGPCHWENREADSQALCQSSMKPLHLMLSSECFFHAKRDAENDNAVAALDPKVSVVLFTGVETGFLVGGFNPLKNMKVSWGYYSQYMESHKTCSKPPTRYLINHY